MPDIRSLLEETTRRAPHPDPVGAVHTAVRRRAARRRAMVAASTAVVVGSGALAVTRTDGGPGTAPVAASTAWRVARAPDGSPGPDDRRLVEYVREHPQRFAYFGVAGNPARTEHGIGIGADADESALRAELEPVAGSARWRFLRCARTLPDYDRIAAEVAAATWPSGARLRHSPRFAGDTTGGTACRVEAWMPYIGAHPADRAYAAERWPGGDVAVVHRQPIEEGTRLLAPPDPDIDDEDGNLYALADVADAHPEAFVGIYVADRVAVVVHGAGVDPADWHRQVRAAAGTLRTRTVQCAVTKAELDAVQAALPGFDWPSGKRPAFGSYVDARTCSVAMQTGPLPPEDAEALREAFGAKITIDQNGAPRRD